MFEKEAEEYAHEHCCDSCKNLQARYKKVFKDGAEFGYNFAKEEIDYLTKHWRSEEERKANEWHYPSKGEYPKDEKNYQSYVVAFYGAKGSFANGKPCWEELCYDTETKRWVDRDTLDDLPYVNKKGIVIAWKEIILPSEPMRSLNKEEQKNYTEAINKVYKPIGVKLFDKENE